MVLTIGLTPPPLRNSVQYKHGFMSFMTGNSAGVLLSTLPPFTSSFPGDRDQGTAHALAPFDPHIGDARGTLSTAHAG